MISKQHSRCSGWAQQGSNLRPLGEQPAYAQSRSSHYDLVEQRSAYDQSCADTTTKVDAKWTADHGLRVPVQSRRITDPILAPVAVQISPRTCIQMLADGWSLAQDLRPSCTRQFMAALDGIGKPLSWHPNFTARAAGSREGADR